MVNGGIDMDKKNCTTCIYWKGRTDMNKCKLNPAIIPDWSVGCDKFKEIT